MSNHPKVSVVMPVLAPHEWQRSMTRCAIETLRCTTKRAFELVVVQAGNPWINRHVAPWGQFVNRVVNFERPTGNVTMEINAGIDASEGEVIVYTGNDVFVRDGWLEALLETLALPGCGVATLASSDLRHAIGQMPRDDILEGVYGPFMAFRKTTTQWTPDDYDGQTIAKGWRFDAEAFPCQFADSDLVARMYEAGLASYRNFKVVIHHLNKQTLGTDANQRDFRRSHERFIARHGKNPHGIVRALCSGQIV